MSSSNCNFYTNPNLTGHLFLRPSIWVGHMAQREVSSLPTKGKFKEILLRIILPILIALVCIPCVILIPIGVIIKLIAKGCTSSPKKEEIIPPPIDTDRIKYEAKLDKENQAKKEAKKKPQEKTSTSLPKPTDLPSENHFGSSKSKPIRKSVVTVKDSRRTIVKPVITSSMLTYDPNYINEEAIAAQARKLVGGPKRYECDNLHNLVRERNRPLKPEEPEVNTKALINPNIRKQDTIRRQKDTYKDKLIDDISTVSTGFNKDKHFVELFDFCEKQLVRFNKKVIEVHNKSLPPQQVARFSVPLFDTQEILSIKKEIFKIILPDTNDDDLSDFEKAINAREEIDQTAFFSIALLLKNHPLGSDLDTKLLPGDTKDKKANYLNLYYYQGIRIRTALKNQFIIQKIPQYSKQIKEAKNVITLQTIFNNLFSDYNKYLFVNETTNQAIRNKEILESLYRSLFPDHDHALAALIKESQPLIVGEDCSELLGLLLAIITKDSESIIDLKPYPYFAKVLTQSLGQKKLSNLTKNTLKEIKEKVANGAEFYEALKSLFEMEAPFQKELLQINIELSKHDLPPISEEKQIMYALYQTMIPEQVYSELNTEGKDACFAEFHREWESETPNIEFFNLLAAIVCTDIKTTSFANIIKELDKMNKLLPSSEVIQTWKNHLALGVSVYIQLCNKETKEQFDLNKNKDQSALCQMYNNNTETVATKLATDPIRAEFSAADSAAFAAALQADINRGEAV